MKKQKRDIRIKRGDRTSIDRCFVDEIPIVFEKDRKISFANSLNE